MADEKITIDVSEALADIAKLKGGMVDVQAQAAKTGAAITKSFDAEGAKGVADAVNELQKEYDQLKSSADTLKRALKGATEPAVVKLYARSIAELEVGMQKLEKTGKAAGVSLKEANKAAGTGKEVFNGLFGAITKASIILAVIEGVRQLTVYAVGLSQEIKKAKLSFEAFTGSAEQADKIVERLLKTSKDNFLGTEETLKAGKTLLAFGEAAGDIPDILERIANTSAATGKDFGELVTIYGKARAAGVLYAEDINQLVDAGIPIIQEFAKQMGVTEGEIKKLASEGKISFAELELAMFNLNEQGGKFAGQAQIQAQGLSGAWQNVVSTAEPALRVLGDIASEVATVFLNLYASVLSFYSNLVGITEEPVKIEVDYTGRDAYEKAKDDLYERERLEKAAAASRNKQSKDAAAKAAALEVQRQQAILNGMKDGVEKQVAQEKFRFSQLKKELRKFNLDTSEAEQQHQDNIAEIHRREADRILQAAKDNLEILKGIYELDTENFEKAEKKKADALNKRESGLEKTKALALQQIDIAEETGNGIINALKAQGKSESEIKAAQAVLDNEIQKARLQAELDFQIALLEISNAGDGERTQEILNNIDLIRKKIENVGSGEKPGKKLSLLQRMGLDDDAIKGLRAAASEVIDILQGLTQGSIDLAEEELGLAQARVDEKQAAFDKEAALAEQGFANNSTRAQQELDLAKASEAKALEEKKKAQKQALQLDTALQLSGLITSSANIIKSFSGIPFGLGIPLAIGVIGSMFAAFTATKVKAFQALKLRKGAQGAVSDDGVIIGRSHEGGGVPIEVEGGEFFSTDGKRFGVVNKRMTAKHFDLLAAINRDDKNGMAAALRSISGPMADRNAISGSLGASGSSIAYFGGVDKETKRLLGDWRSEQAKRAAVSVEGNYLVERSGGFTRKTRIKK